MSLLRMIGSVAVAIGAAVVAPMIAFSEDEPAQRQFFESKIRPLLIEKCQSCHEGDEPESKLRVDSLDGLLIGGIRGPSVIPGKPAESLLISAVKHGEVLKMPAKEKLPAAQIADLVKWVETGAYWPDAGPVTPVKPNFAEPDHAGTILWRFQPQRHLILTLSVRDLAPFDRFGCEIAEAGACSVG
jgi:hypothetical protein